LERPLGDVNDRELGMRREITRRDFLNGVALTLGAAIVPSYLLLPSTLRPIPKNRRITTHPL